MTYVEFSIDHVKKSEYNFLNLMANIKSKVISEINKLLLIKNNLKVGLGVEATWVKVQDRHLHESDIIIDEDEQFHGFNIKRLTLDSKHITIYNKENVDSVLSNMMKDLEEKIESVRLSDTGWSIKRIHSIYLKSFTNKAVRGSNYIQTPDKYKNSKCGLINIQNDDQECFKWCMKYHQSEMKEKSHRVTALKKVNDKYNYENVDFPASLKDIEQFENNNKISVFVYSLNDKDEIYREKLGNPDYFTNDVVYLLRLDREDQSHYIYIKHLERFFNLNRHDSQRDKNYCPYCEKQCEDDMPDHIKKCYKLQFNDGALLKLPPPNSYMKFENHKNKLIRPFIVYADCESTLIPNNHKNKIHKHKVNSCCCYFVCTFDSSRNELMTFVGDNCLKDMSDKLFNIADECIAEMKINNRMIMTKDDNNDFNNATCCFLCNEPFNENDKKLLKVRDHDHMTGKYRGAAHCKCNINFFSNRYLPIVFHNLKAYDSHLIIKEMYKLYPDKDNNIIPKNYEKICHSEWVN